MSTGAAKVGRIDAPMATFLSFRQHNSWQALGRLEIICIFSTQR